MRRLAPLLFLLTFVIACGSADAATNFNVWQPKGAGPTNPSSGGLANPSVIYTTTNCQVIANPCFQMWSGESTGTNEGVYLHESADGLTSWTAYSGNPVLAAGPVNVPTVYLEGGTYYLYLNGGPSVLAYTSPTGITWTIQNSGNPVLTPGSAGAWDSDAVYQINICDIVAGTWYAYYAGLHAALYSQGLITSTDGIHWTKSLSNPAITGFGGTDVAQTTFYNVGGSYYAYSSCEINNTQLLAAGKTNLCRFSAPTAAGPWTELLLGGSPVYTYYPAIAADFPFTTGGSTIETQVGDPRLLVANGNIYLYYTIGCCFGVQKQINEAFIPNTTLIQLVATNEGVFNAPFFGNPSVNLITLGSDNFARANQNPIAGNWSRIGTTSFTTLQLISNTVEVSSANNAGAAYWNPVSWTNDQWSQVGILASNAGSNVGVALRGNTSGAWTTYFFIWNGALGSSGTWMIQKYVSGTLTVLIQDTGLTVSSNDTIMGVVIGSNLMFYWNGFLIDAFTDSAVASGNAGMFMFANGATSVAVQNNWSGGTFTGGLPFVPNITPIVISENVSPNFERRADETPVSYIPQQEW